MKVLRAFPMDQGEFRPHPRSQSARELAWTFVVEQAADARFNETVKFFTGPGQMSDIPVIQLAWFMLCDQIHHRGQYSVYVRMAGGKVPAIYGPSADEPWM